jgi:NAD(P)H-dependent FMN reductase
MDQLNIPVLLGTNRKLRKSIFAAKWLVSEMDKRAEIRTRLFDAADFALPHDDYGQEIKDRFPEWRDAIIQADGLVIVTPEYNHGYPGSLKAVLDLLLREYVHKSVAFVGVSAGPWGGTRVIEAMVPMVRELMAPRLNYRITMGVRQGEDAWKRELNSLNRRPQGEIDAILREAGVPLLNDMGTELRPEG